MLESGRSAEDDSWVVRASAYTPNPMFEPFRMEIIGRDNGRLFGIATYGDYRSGRLPVKIEGICTPDGGFWPDVSGATTTNLNGPWKTVAIKQAAGQKAVLEVTSLSPNIMLYIALDPFLPFADKERLGRVVLQNKAAAVFRLKDLLGPAIADNNHPPKWERRLMGGAADPIAKLPFTVVTIGSAGDGIEGTCAYLTNVQTEVDGTRTLDEKFWPNVVAQVANDYQGVWRVLGKPLEKGKPTTLIIKPNDTKTLLHVRLDLFQSMVGKFRYGRVVLKNDVSAVFELKDILPP